MILKSNYTDIIILITKFILTKLGILPFFKKDEVICAVEKCKINNDVRYKTVEADTKRVRFPCNKIIC